MTAPFASAILPYSDDERAADETPKRRADRVALIRRLSAPHGRYDIPPSPQSKALDLRKIGESGS